MDERKYNCLIEMKENVKKDKILELKWLNK